VGVAFQPQAALMNGIASIPWSPDTSAWDPKPEWLVESLFNFASYVGIKGLLLYAALFYLLPLIGIGAAATTVHLMRKKRFLLHWPDALMPALPVGVWLVLSLTYPIGRPASSLWELVLLGVIGASTLTIRSLAADSGRGEMAEAGLLVTTSLAVCFWAFMPQWNGWIAA